MTPYRVRANLERVKAVNDLHFALNGDLYFTDQGQTGLHDPTGRLFRVKPDGRVECLLDNVPSPNGLVMNLSETMVYLAVTRGNCVWRVPLRADGGVAKVGVFVQLSGGWGGPDGLAPRNLVTELAGAGVTSKRRVGPSGREFGGKPFACGAMTETPRVPMTEMLPHLPVCSRLLFSFNALRRVGD